MTQRVITLQRSEAIVNYQIQFLQGFCDCKIIVTHSTRILHTGNKKLDQNYKTKGKKDLPGLGSNQVPLGYEPSMLPLHHESRRWLGKKSLDVNHVD